MKPTCIAYTNTYVCNSQTCGFHPTLINELYTDEIFKLSVGFYCIAPGNFLKNPDKQGKLKNFNIGFLNVFKR